MIPGEAVRATIILPTMAGRGPLLRLSVASVLAQSVTGIELFIIGDGVDEDTRHVVHDLMSRDPRIRFFDHEKHESRGEPNRHAALADAQGEIVCYLCDRDLMLPHHVETMLALLRDADFAHTLISATTPAGDFRFLTSVDMANPKDREWILRGWALRNGIPLSFAGHTLNIYRKLPYGWRTTPPDIFTDIHMWEQFLAQEQCRAISGTVPTIVYFPKFWRSDWTNEKKLAELQGWSTRIAAADWKEQIMQLTINGLSNERLLHKTQLELIGVGLNRVGIIYNQMFHAGPPDLADE